MSEIRDSCGGITAEWFRDELSDFMYTFDDDPRGEFISRVNHISNVYNKTGEDVASELIAFAANQKRTHMDIAFIDLYEQTVLTRKVNQTANDSTYFTSTQKQRVVLGEHNVNRLHNQSVDSDTAADESSYFMETDEPDGPILEPKYIHFTPVKCSRSNAAYQNRKNSDKVMQSYVGKLFALSQLEEEEAKWKAHVEFIDWEQEYTSLLHFGNEKDAEQIEEICSRIDMLSDAIRMGNQQISAFQRCQHVSSEPFFICGQIVDESGEGLEVGGCYVRSNEEDASMVHVDLQQLTEFSLFPGKPVGLVLDDKYLCFFWVVALRGINENGTVFVASEMLEPAKMQLASIVRQPTIDRLRVWCAAGPFTSDNTLSYEQLCDLLDLAKKEQPHILILMGPFVDRTSTATLSPKLTLSFTDLFECLLMNMSAVLEETAIQVILIPNSKKDATALPIFPTAPLQVSVDCKKNLSENIMFGADPSQIRIEGVHFAVTNSEIMQVIGRVEIHRSSAGENEERMARIAGHILRQRSLYPVYPPPIDIAQRPAEVIRRCALKAIPHVMIVPSMLAPMVKVVDGCVCINPGMLARGNGGTFMKMEIDLAMLGSEPSELSPNCTIADFCEVKVVRI